jgi:hypothetical protein
LDAGDSETGTEVVAPEVLIRAGVQKIVEDLSKLQKIKLISSGLYGKKVR